MGSVLHNITANPDSFMFLMIFGVLGAVGLTVVVMLALRSMAATREREQTRREIAAHIAAGSLSPQDGERLLEAGTADPGSR